MKQIVQDVRSGVTAIREIPVPIAAPGQVLVANAASLVSAGTERYVVELARSNLIGKARQRPDQVKRLLQKLKEEGLIATVQQVMAKLDEPMPLGYSCAGVVLECGRGVHGMKPGDRVAAAGPHAGVVSVGRNLCARIPDGVTFEQGAYTSVAAIGLEGVRLARVALGDSVLVIGLGLIGQICVALLKAQGCRVFGTDIDGKRLDLARTFGADAVGPVESLPAAMSAFTGGFGVDAVVITAATRSNEPIELAAAACRTKGRIVLVGVVGLNLPRPPFFAKELEFTVSSSLGPGRGDPSYEEKGVDYPIGHARWTAGRNMEAVLDLMAEGKLPVERLTTHRFPIERAEEAYDLITGERNAALGVLIEYAGPVGRPRRRVDLAPTKAATGEVGISLVGAGNFARLVLVPTLARIDGYSWRGLCSARGLSAEHVGRGRGFAFATSDFAELLADAGTKAVIIATRHDLHAELVVAALRAGKDVFVEKPLCIREEELASIAACVDDLGDRCPILMVGFNRRFAPATTQVAAFFEGVGPLSIAYRFSPGPVPAGHWTQDEDVGGGRIVGEACHAIDTCTAIASSPPVRVFSESAGQATGVETTDDRIFITLRHANGSVSCVSYQAGGDRALPSERIEVFGGGRSAVVDGWDRIDLWRGGKAKRAAGGKDKGHRAELLAFVAACRAGGPSPIPLNELLAVSEAALLAVRSLRDGLPQDLALGR